MALKTKTKWTEAEKARLREIDREVRRLYRERSPLINLKYSHPRKYGEAEKRELKRLEARIDELEGEEHKINGPWPIEVAASELEELAVEVQAVQTELGIAEAAQAEREEEAEIDAEIDATRVDPRLLRRDD